MIYTNVAGYKFITLKPAQLTELQDQLKQKAHQQQIKGTILLSHEGINLFLAGTPQAIQIFSHFLGEFLFFADIQLKISHSECMPFKRLHVRIKKEIIKMNVDEINPIEKTAPYIEATQLNRWLSENKEMVLLDTRNDFEFSMGSFTNAVHLNLKSFNHFPDAVKNLPESLKKRAVVTFCTGGIRCEKAAAYLLKQGYQQVWQLKGGILEYFQQCGGQFFQGNCFVFDERIALDHQLNTVGA